MSAIRLILGLMWRADRRAFLLGLGLTVATLAAGALLLGLAGWFIAACALAGAAGIGVGFDFFRPSAAVRFLALARTAARYGERLTTHDATLRFLAALRGRLFRGLAARPAAALSGLRRASALHRLTADVDALDAAYLRLFAPVFAAIVTLALAAALLAWLTDAAVAAWVVGCHGAGGIAALAIAARFGGAPSSRKALALEALRTRLIDLVHGGVALALNGRLDAQRAAIGRADAKAAAAEAAIDRLDLALTALGRLSGAAAAAGALVLGGAAGLAAPSVAIGVFAALALGEATAPLARGALELGRMRLAAARTARDLAAAPAPSPPPAVARAQGGRRAGEAEPALVLEAVSFARGAARAPVLEGFSLTARRGEWIALAGPSGAGKSSALMLAAGLYAPSAGRVLVEGRDAARLSEAALRARLALLPQRSALFAGTVAENLRLAAPDASEDALIDALEATRLWSALAAREGLETRLGEGGTGLSGGQARRLALARVILRRPAILLLDEPTEGLDAPLAEAVLAALRDRFAGSAVVAASHRAAELAVADRTLRLEAAPFRPACGEKSGYKSRLMGAD